MSDHSRARPGDGAERTRGRRSAAGARRAWSPVAIAVVAVPVLVAGALWTLNPTPEQSGAGPSSALSPPTPIALDAIDLLCPSPFGKDPVLSVARAEESVSEANESQAEGEIVVGLGETSEPLEVPVGGVVVAPTPSDAEVVSGTGAMAPGLFGSLAQAKPRAATDCPTAAPELWFTGVGAGPTHASQLELLNPDEANAVADVTVFSDEGVVDVPDLRGIGVPGGSSLRLNLAELLPQRGQLGLKVAVSRGRLGVFLVDEDDELGAGDVSQEWVPAQPDPALTSVLLGSPPGAEGRHKLVVTNPGPNEAVVSLKVLTSTSAFTPAGLSELQIPPDSVGVFSLADVLSRAAPKDSKKDDNAPKVAGTEETVLGLVIESSEPVATSLRSVVDGDLSFTGVATPVEHGRTVVPGLGAKDSGVLVLSGGLAPTTASVRFLDEGGAVLAEQDVSGAASTASEIDVPEDTASISVDSSAGVSAALLVTGPKGNVILTLQELLTTLLVPDVQPAIR